MRRIAILTVLFLSTASVKAEINFGPLNWIVDNWAAIDSSYIEPSHYNFTVTPTFQLSQERFRVSSENGMEMNFKSRTTNKLGASLGWRFLSIGLSWDLNRHIDNTFEDDRQKTEFNLSVFSQLLNIDFFYRQTGGDFEMTKLYIPQLNGAKINGEPIDEVLMHAMNEGKVSGALIDSKMIGFNGYYIFNHKKFSYPAAWTVASRQKRSAGSAIAGFGYNYHKVENTLWNLPVTLIAFASLVDDFPFLKTPEEQKTFMKKSSVVCSSFKYNDWSLWGGYAYNWIPCKNLLVGASATLGLGIKKSSGNNDDFIKWVKEIYSALSLLPDPYSFSRTIADWNAVGRASIVWNNDRFFCGAKGNINYYRYKNGNSKMNMDDTFWSADFYFGLKFGESKYWKKAKHKSGI